MKSVARLKVSVSLPADLIGEIDRATKAHEGATRSGVMEAWLREAERLHSQARLDEATEVYYGALSEEEQSADAEWAEGAAKVLGEVTRSPPGFVVSSDRSIPAASSVRRSPPWCRSSS